MIKAVIVKSNKIEKIVVVKDLENIKLEDSQVAYEYPKDKKLKVGDAFDSTFGRILRTLGLK